MTTFLQRSADRILAEHGHELANICVVLPSRRAAAYLRKELSAKLEKPFWAPRFFNMQDLFNHFSQYGPLDPSEALFDLYNAYVKVKGKKDADDLGAFLSWGPTLLRDINDVDNYLLDPIPFFTDLRNIKEIEDWSLGANELTKDQLRFTELWKEQGEIYRIFSKLTQEKGLATYGAMGRDISINVEAIPENIDIHKFWFIGSNALSKSESLLIEKLIRAGKAECLWDADEHYFENTVHEAGYFQRKNKNSFPNQKFNWVSEDLKSVKKKIEAIAAPNDLTQVQAACTILEELANKGDIENTVVVLPDQRLLMPLLMALPERIEHFNITMGSPLLGTPSLELLLSMILLHEKRIRSGKQLFYYKDVQRILLHPLLLKAFSGIDRLAMGNKAYLSAKDIIKEEHTDEQRTLSVFFGSESTPDNVLNGIQNILLALAKSEELHVVEREFALQTLALWERIIQIQKETVLIHDLRTLQKLTKHLSREHEVSFIGEPLKGLQIMGVLETRAIDIDRVIYLSMNEGNLPQEDKSNTFIPYDLRELYQLPTRTQNAAIQAYNFYRSIQRASKVHLIWKDEGATTKGGGRSRFIAQMEHELAEQNNIEFIQKNVGQPSLERIPAEIRIVKNEAIIQQLKELLKSGLSPSAMSTFIHCPLDFYYKYVLGIRAAEDALEHLDIPGLGTVVHEAAEALFAPFIKKDLDPEMLKASRSRISDVVKQAFKKEHPYATLERGKDLLHFEIVKKFMHDYIDREMERCKMQELRVEGLELLLRTELELNINGEQIPIVLKGKADRIDRTPEGIVLIDLKTGKLKNNELKVKSFEDIIDKPQIKALQLLTYAYLFQKNNEGIEKVGVGIFPFGNSSNGLVLCEIEGNTSLTRDKIESFEEALHLIVSSLLDTEQAFVHNDESKYCELCN